MTNNSGVEYGKPHDDEVKPLWDIIGQALHINMQRCHRTMHTSLPIWWRLPASSTFQRLSLLLLGKLTGFSTS